MTPAPPAPDWLQATFAEALAWGEAAHGDRIAVIHGDAALTFTQLAVRVRDLARGLMALGVAPDDKVALWMSDGPEWLVARWAVPMIGALLVPVNTRFRDQDVRYVLEQSDTCLLIAQQCSPTGTDYFDILARIEPDYRSQAVRGWKSPALPALRQVVGLQGGASGPALPASMTSFEDVEALGRGLRDDGALALRTAGVGAGDVAQILYTSGTTSFPKGAMVCHGALLQNNWNAIDYLRLSPADRYLSCVPLFTATGTFYTLALWFAGARMVIVDRFDPRQFCETVQRECITLSFFVDTIVQDLRAFADRASYDLTSLRTGSGAPLPTASFRWMTDVVGVPELVSAYGMSETSNAVARTRWDDPIEKRSTTCGRAVPGVTLKVIDVDTGDDLPSGRVGEICVSGYVVMKGYYRLPEEDAKAFDRGWMRTGDLGELDEAGYLRYRGRVKEMIKPGGFNVSTQEIEVFLKGWEGVRQAVVVGVPDARLGEVAYAYIEPAPGAALDVPALLAHCRAHVAGYKVPRHVEITFDWPLTGSQKIRKLELKERARRRVAETAGAEALPGRDETART